MREGTHHLATLGFPAGIRPEEVRNPQLGHLGKPENPYFKHLDNGRISILWSVFEGDREDLTAAQIAEVLGCTPGVVYSYIWKIQKETGYEIPHIRRERRRKRDA